MDIKQIEIRDRGTFVPALAVRVSRADGWLIGAAGFGDEPTVILFKLETGEGHWDAHDWEGGGASTMGEAHEYLQFNWHEFRDEGMLDLRRLRGETETDSPSEREYRSGGRQSNGLSLDVADD